jgi:hypothetical protein
MTSHITRYELMPIPPVPEHTETFEAGVVAFGVEYRLLNDAIAAASDVAPAQGREAVAQRAVGERSAGPREDGTGSAGSLDDRGVSIHVFAEIGGERQEVLRFDCFQEDPHYHYVSWSRRSNEMLHIDPVADGDPLAWALERIRTRLPQMLERAGAADAAAKVDLRRVDAVLPRVVEAAFRARYQHDDAAILRGALAASGR